MMIEILYIPLTKVYANLTKIPVYSCWSRPAYNEFYYLNTIRFNNAIKLLS